jgi:hypothetical protein
MKAPKVKYLSKKIADDLRISLSGYPNAGPGCSITGMRKKFWGFGAYLVKSGSYVYKVPKSVYDRIYPY